MNLSPLENILRSRINSRTPLSVWELEKLRDLIDIEYTERLAEIGGCCNLSTAPLSQHSFLFFLSEMRASLHNLIEFKIN